MSHISEILQFFKSLGHDHWLFAFRASCGLSGRLSLRNLPWISMSHNIFL